VARRRREFLASRFRFQALLEVPARAEVFAGCRENDAAALRFVIEALQRRGKVGDKVDIDEIVRRTP
jgi:hypothetical protein